MVLYKGFSGRMVGSLYAFSRPAPVPPPLVDTQFFILRWIPQKPSRAQKEDKKDIFLSHR